MDHRLEGRKFWRAGDHRHVWVVDAVITGRAERPDFAILVSQDGSSVDEVDLSHLENPNLYTPARESE